jgi:putative toxin-antitoxin system antitoxin component (TIGR02293 family)
MERDMSEVVLKQTAEFLGLRRTLHSQLELMPVIRQGLSPASLESVSRKMDLSPRETGESLGFAKRTLTRRLREKQPLTPEESERVVRLVRVLVQAIEVLGSLEKARRWLQKSNRALGGEIPLRLLDNDIGGNAVLEELGRIEHGVFA